MGRQARGQVSVSSGCTQTWEDTRSNTLPLRPALLQGDYSIRRLAAAAEQDGARLAGEATPRPDQLIGAYTPGGGRAAVGGGDAGTPLSAAKTPLLPQSSTYTNPLF